MAADAEGLRAGQATIELSLLEGRLNTKLRKLNRNIRAEFRDLARYTAHLAHPMQALAGSGGIAGVASRALPLWSRLGGVFSRIRVSSGGFMANLRKLGNLSGFGGGFGGGGFGGLRNLLVGSAAAAAAAWPVKLAANMELATAQMSVFTGSTQIARDAMMDLLKFSAVSGQGPEDMANQMRLLMTRDISSDEALSYIKSLTVLAAGSTEEFQQLTKAFADVKSATRLNGEEMRQFKNTAFNPFVEIAKRTGESFQQLKARMEAGGITFEEVAHALQSSVRSGGLFNGMLEKISGTLTGQFRMALANLKLAVLPIGEALLPALTKFGQAVNGILPLVGALAKKYAGWVASIVGVAAGLAFLAVSTISVGLGFTLLSIAVSGVIGALGAVVSLFGFLTSLPVLLIVLLGELAASFVIGTEAGRAMVQNLGTAFGKLHAHSIAVFKGIADALKFGDIQLAGRIMWSGMKVAWLEGTQGLMSIWLDFKNAYLKSVISMGAQIEHALKAQFASINGAMIKGGMDTAAFFLKIGKTDAQKKSIDQATAFSKSGIDIQTNQQIQAQVREQMAAQKLIEALFAGKSQRELDAYREKLKDARAELKKLMEQAAAGAAGLPDFGLGALLPDMAAAGMATAKETARRSEGVFDTRLAQQMFGSNDQQLEALRKIERNTRMQRRRAGLPVI